MGTRIKRAHMHLALLRTADLRPASNNAAAVERFNNTSHTMKEKLRI